MGPAFASVKEDYGGAECAQVLVICARSTCGGGHRRQGMAMNNLPAHAYLSGLVAELRKLPTETPWLEFKP